MKKLFTFMLALVAAVAVNAATEVTFDFSDASAYGYANPEAGKYTQVPNGAVLSKDDVTITVAFESGNGFRFFTHSTTGVINLRGYVGSSFTIAAPEGKKLSAIAADGLNLTSQYLADGMTSKNWSNAEGVASLTTNVIKSTVQFNSLTITLIEEGEVPPTQETVKVDVAGAIAAGMALDSAKTSTDVYEVTGYVVNAQAYSDQHKNQIWWMADDAENSAEQEFEAYACTVSEANVVMQVLNGDKVTLTGNITKYYDKNNQKFIIEIKNGTALFLEKVEGDHSIDGGGTPVVTADTITVARALAIGDSIGDGNTTEGQYVIDGYVTALTNNRGEPNADGGWSQYKNQCMWVADTFDEEAITKETAFFIYQGVAPEQVTKGAKIRVTCAIKNYNGMIETAASKGAITILEKGEDPVPPAAPDTITVARALAIGDSIGQGKTTSEMYVVDGYVISAEAFYQANKNQTWTMADEADAVSASFKAYRCVPVYNNDTVKVLKGDKVRLCGAIQNYNGTIEISYAKAEFLSMVEGDHSPSAPDPQEPMDTITVAQALEIGQALDSAGVTPVQYVIKGYVSNIITPYDTINKNETFWMVDEKGSRAASNKDGAFEVYRGKPDTEAEIGLDAYVYVTAKIQKFRGTTIETSGAATVQVVEQGHEEVIESITVARAMEIGNALADKAVSDARYEITGYVSHIAFPYDTTYKNESFWIMDEKGSTGASAAAGAFYVYRGKPNTGAEIGMNAKIQIVCKIKNYGGTIENDGSNIVFEVLEQGEEIVPEVVDTISVARALELGRALADNGISEKEYVIGGYVSSIKDYFNPDYKNETFWIADEKGSRVASNADGAFYVYRGKPDTEAEIGLDAKVYITCKIKKYGSGESAVIENEKANCAVTVAEQGTVEVIESITVAQAMEIGSALADKAVSDARYEITGYVSHIATPYDTVYKNESFWIMDEKGSTGTSTADGAFYIFRGKPNTGAEIGMNAKIKIVCKIKNYGGTIENDGSNIVFEVLEQGEDIVPEVLDTITVAHALELGYALNDNQVTPKQYVISGYVSSIENYFDTINKNETFWIADEPGTTVASNSDGAFYVYRGKPDSGKEMGWGAKVYVTTTIKKFVKECQAPVIENENANAAVSVIEQGEEEDIQSITVAEAVELGQALASKATTPVRYEITGYVSSINEPFSNYGNETFWITDEKGSRAASSIDGAFEVYRGKPNTGAEIGLNAKIKIVCKIKNYNGTIENDGQGVAFEVLEQGDELQIDTISVSRAIAIGMELENNSYSADLYVVKGFAVRAYAPDSCKTSQNVYMADDPDAYGDFEAYSCSPDYLVQDGDYILVLGKLQKYVGKSITIEIGYGRAVHADAPKLDTLTVAQALEVGAALEDNTVAEDRCVVVGYVASIEAEYEEEIQSFSLSDSNEAVSGEFKAVNAFIDEPGAEIHNRIAITGYIQKVVAGGITLIRMEKGKAQIIPEEGIMLINASDSAAKKVLIDGVIYIVRDNKIFNLQGAQVR